MGWVMGAYLEVWTTAGRELVALEAGRLTLGADPTNDLALPADPTLSRLHAALERYGAGWCVRDLDSRNGTFVNGQRVWRERPLRPGDELRVGATRLIYRSDEPGGKSTQASEPPPELTRREREVLLVLCRTVLGGAAFTEPASIRETPLPWSSPRPPSSSIWPTCTTSSASTAVASGAGSSWPTRRYAAGR